MVLIQTKSGTLRRLLLICGIIAIPLYAITDMLAGVLYPGYSFTDQAVSELFAIGAPTSRLVVPLFTVYSLFILAFGIGLWMSAGSKRSLRFMSLMIFANAINGLLLWNLFPMHMRGEEMTSIDLAHATLAATGGIFGALAIGFGSVAFGRRFRFYSIGTIAMMFVPTILVFPFVHSHLESNSNDTL